MLDSKKRSVSASALKKNSRSSNSRHATKNKPTRRRSKKLTNAVSRFLMPRKRKLVVQARLRRISGYSLLVKKKKRVSEAAACQLSVTRSQSTCQVSKFLPSMTKKKTCWTMSSLRHCSSTRAKFVSKCYQGAKAGVLEAVLTPALSPMERMKAFKTYRLPLLTAAKIRWQETEARIESAANHQT